MKELIGKKFKTRKPNGIGRPHINDWVYKILKEEEDGMMLIMNLGTETTFQRHTDTIINNFTSGLWLDEDFHSTGIVNNTYELI